MRRHCGRTALVSSMLLVALTTARADCVAQAAQPRPSLIELYTSEGCSSCPPADSWLRKLPDSSAVALAFHVDYWDSLGWRDRFADARYTRRQQEQSQRDGGSGIYTPQVVLDGRSWSGWYRHADLPARPAARADMHVTITRSDALRVHVDTRPQGAADPAYRNYVALTQDGLSSRVSAGENRGAVLRHDHVVRAFAGPLPLQADVELPLPAPIDAGPLAVVVFAQRPGDGDLAQVLVCALPDPR